MKNKILIISIITITFLIVTSIFTQALAASDEPYKMQEIVKLDKKLNTLYKTKRKYYNGGSKQLIVKTKSNYGYNDLSNRSNSYGRISLYNKIYKLYSDMYNTNDTINPIVDHGNKYYVIGEIDFNAIGLKANEAIETYFTFRNDHPIFYYSNNTVIYSNTTIYITIFEEYASGEVRQELETSIASAIEIYAAQIEKDSDDYNKILTVHDYLCKNMTYVATNKVYEHNIIGALVEKKGVCEAYSRTFELIMNYLGIENVFVTGTANIDGNSQAHAWNLVKLDKYYYWVDCTWDDQTQIIYTYFMKGNMSWDSHTVKNENIEDFLYELPNTIADISISYQAIEIFENGISIGKANSSQEAFNTILARNNVNSQYELVFNNMQDITTYYLLPSGQWPKAKNIILTSLPIKIGSRFVYISTMIYDDVTLNSNLTISGLNFTTMPNAYSNNLNIGSYTFNTPKETSKTDGITIINTNQINENCPSTNAKESRSVFDIETIKQLRAINNAENIKQSTNTQVLTGKVDKITLSKTTFTYNKKVQKPTVTIKDSRGKVLKNYTVKYSNKNSKKVGQYTIIITFKGNYKGTKKLTYTIKPKGTAISKLTKGKRQFIVTWKKQKNETTGYQIQYSTNSKFSSGNKIVNIKKNKTTVTTIKKLKNKKKYYVRIRTYKNINGKKIYSGWSKVVKVKTK